MEGMVGSSAGQELIPNPTFSSSSLCIAVSCLTSGISRWKDDLFDGLFSCGECEEHEAGESSKEGLVSCISVV